jgi:DNA-binding PadR family transcriptional regulator
MEYFILALIEKAKLTTLYAFQQRAGLQPGGIRPALHRLEEAGLITRAESSKRQRKALSLTPQGLFFLTQTWQVCLRDHPDTESVLRAACVALLMGDRNRTSQYLEQLALSRQTMAEEKKMNTQQLERTQKDPVSTYLWMRTLCEAKRRHGESEVLEALSQSLRQKDQPSVVRQQP